jgi:hypothetical protein
MKPANQRILTMNGGSSSIKFALFEAGHSLRRILEGRIERIGLPEATFWVKGLNQADNFSRLVTAPDHTVAVGTLVDWIEERTGHDALTAVGHHVVHGGPKYSKPQRITAEMVEDLHERFQERDKRDARAPPHNRASRRAATPWRRCCHHGPQGTCCELRSPGRSGRQGRRRSLSRRHCRSPAATLSSPAKACGDRQDERFDRTCWLRRRAGHYARHDGGSIEPHQDLGLANLDLLDQGSHGGSVRLPTCAGILARFEPPPSLGRAANPDAEASYEWSSFRKRTDHVQLSRESATLTPSVEGRLLKGEEAPIGR